VIQPGDKLPQVTGTTHEGETIDFGSFTGRGVLYFYPKANTSGCTTEAREFNELVPRFAEFDVAVIGASVDRREANRAFAEKYGLRFPLICDPERAVSEAFGVLKAPGGSARRCTFLLDQGVVQWVWADVKPAAGHAAEVLEKALELWQFPMEEDRES